MDIVEIIMLVFLASCCSQSTHATQAACNHSEVRLVGGCDSLEGRVEVCMDGEWGTVCDDFWDDDDAQVVCRQLGHTTGNALGFSRALYGEGTGHIFLDTVDCMGDESTLLNCSSEPGPADCHHFEDASVSCFQQGCKEGDIRLAEGSFFSGRVEVCQAGLWGTVCDDLWGEEDASVVCRQLGLMSEGAVPTSVGPGCGPIFFDNVECMRTEEKLVNCSRAVFGDCYHNQDAGVKCALANVTFVPFGFEEGDEFISDNTSSLSFDLPTPVVYYLREEYQVYVSTTGEITFRQEPSFNPGTINSSITMISPQWLINFNGTTLYARVAEDTPTLDMVSRILINENPEMRDFLPSLAVIMTWHNIDREKGTLQASLSTNGMVSFATYLFSNGHGARILKHTDLVIFTAGDGIRSSVVMNNKFSPQMLRSTLNSFRIDGHCITLDSSGFACSLKSYAAICETPLSASTCRCFQARNETTEEAGSGGSGVLMNRTANDTGPADDTDDDMDLETCETTTISCVSGSVASPCIPPSGALNTNYSGCYPTLLPCYFQENCLNETELSDCRNSGLTVFGEGAGDIKGGQDDDAAFGPIVLDTPVIFLNTSQTVAYMSTNGLLSFVNSHPTFAVCGPLPCTSEVIIAPIWTDLDFRGSGVTFYRSSRDPVILGQIASTIADVNPLLDDYQPTQALVFTWFEARSHFDDEQTMLGDQQGSFQLVVSTDGENSFASFVYSDPNTIFLNVLEPELDEDAEEGALEAVIGFDNGERTAGSDYGLFLMRNNQPLPAVNIFRIDGLCITTIQPGEACSLEADTTECDGFRATTCQCQTGYVYNGQSCVDINECNENRCHEESDCFNSPGSFQCVCKTGYMGDGFACTDVNECLLGICGAFSDCVNSIGNFTCICNEGYELAGRNQCLEIVQPTIRLSIAVPIVAGVAAAVLVLAVPTMVVAAIVRRQRIKKKIRLREIEKYYNRRRRRTVRCSFDLQIKDELLVNSSNLELGKTLGQGEFGIVYQAVLKTSTSGEENGEEEGEAGETVAVKTLKGFIAKELVTEMLKECDMMKDFEHPNVLGLKGVCLDGGPAPFIILAFMAKGSLLGYLKDNRESLVLNPDTEPEATEEVQKQLLDMCLQVGKGMEYLAGKRFVHRDLAARNCMIDSNFVIKVADFGLSQILGPEEEFFQQKDEDSVKLPMKWLAIESINERMFSEKTDVWSFGITCWEVFTGGKTPYPDIHPMDLPRQLEEGYRMPKPPNAACTDQVYDIVLKCWDEDSEIRPTFSDCVKDLSECLSNVAKYFDLGARKQDSSTEDGDTELSDD